MTVGAWLKDKGVDVLSLLVSLVALFVAGLAYCYTVKTPEVGVTIGQHIIVNAKPRVGVLCTFTNEGGRQAVIKSASFRWGTATLTLTDTSTTLEQWTYKAGKMQSVTPTTHTLFTPIAVKGHDQATAILWFVSTDAAFKFNPGKHECVLEVSYGAEKPASAKFQVELTADDVKALNDSLATPETSTTEFPIRIEQSQ